MSWKLIQFMCGREGTLGVYHMWKKKLEKREKKSWMSLWGEDFLEIEGGLGLSHPRGCHGFYTGENLEAIFSIIDEIWD